MRALHADQCLAQGWVLHGDLEPLQESEKRASLEKGHRARQPFLHVVHGLSVEFVGTSPTRGGSVRSRCSRVGVEPGTGPYPKGSHTFHWLPRSLSAGT